MKMKRCPKCTNLMPEDVSRCIRCGYDSKPGPAPGAAVAVPANVVPVKAGRFANGIALALQSWEVLKRDKLLLVFPLLSSVSCFLILATYAAGVVVGGVAAGLFEQGKPVNEDLLWLLLFVYYFINYFVIVFFNVALVSCAMTRFQGGTPTVGGGLKAAMGLLPQIVSWALLAATVGVVLRMIEERVGFIGKIVIALLGAVWAIATYFVVPVLVVEKLGPVDAAKRSAEIIKQSWGEAIVGNIGIGVVTFLAFLLVVAPCGAAAFLLAASANSFVIAVAGILLTIALAVLVVLASSALHSIILAALYLYAAERKLPPPFEAGRLQAAFVAK